MKKKNKVILSVLTIFSTLALAGLTFGIIALIWKYVYNNTWLIIGVSLLVLLVLGILGSITFKKIKNKLIDIFT